MLILLAINFKFGVLSLSRMRVLSFYIGITVIKSHSFVIQESTLLLLGKSAPNLINFKFDTLSLSRKRVLSYTSAVNGKRVLS